MFVLDTAMISYMIPNICVFCSLYYRGKSHSSVGSCAFADMFIMCSLGHRSVTYLDEVKLVSVPCVFRQRVCVVQNAFDRRGIITITIYSLKNIKYSIMDMPIECILKLTIKVVVRQAAHYLLPQSFEGHNL